MRKTWVLRRLPSASITGAPVPKSTWASSPGSHSIRRNGNGREARSAALARRHGSSFCFPARWSWPRWRSSCAVSSSGAVWLLVVMVALAAAMTAAVQWAPALLADNDVRYRWWWTDFLAGVIVALLVLLPPGLVVWSFVQFIVQRFGRRRAHAR